MSNTINKHFVLTSTTEEEQLYYIVCSTHTSSSSETSVDFHWATSHTPLLPGQAVNIFPRTHFSATGHHIHTIEPSFIQSSTFNSQQNRLDNLYSCAMATASSISKHDYFAYLEKHKLTEDVAKFSEYIHRKSEAVSQLLLSMRDISEESAPRDNMDRVIFSTNSQKILDSDRERTLYRTTDTMYDIIYNLNDQDSELPYIYFINAIANNAIPNIQQNIQQYHDLNNQCASQFNTPAMSLQK